MRPGSAAQAQAPAKPAAAPVAAAPANVPVAKKQEELVRWDVLGRSLENRVIEYSQFGNGKHRVLVVGACAAMSPRAWRWPKLWAST